MCAAEGGGGGRAVERVEDQAGVLGDLAPLARVGEHTEGGFAGPEPTVTATVHDGARRDAVQAGVEIALLPPRVRSPLQRGLAPLVTDRASPPQHLVGRVRDRIQIDPDIAGRMELTTQFRVLILEMHDPPLGFDW